MGQVEGQRFPVEEKGIAVAEGQVGEPAAEVETIFPGMTDGSDPMVVEVSVVRTRYLLHTQQGCQQRRAEKGNQKEVQRRACPLSHGPGTSSRY